MNSAATPMRDRAAGENVIENLLEAQSEVPARGVVAKLFGRTPLGEDSHSWYEDALGEIAVGRALEQLPSEWTAFHALPVGTKGSAIDHLVVGPGGIFTIKTRRHRGDSVLVSDRSVMVSGQHRPYLRDAEHDADSVARILKERTTLLTPIQPIVALVGPKQITIRQAPDRVKVLDSRQLQWWLAKRPVILPPADVLDVAAIVDDPATWREGTVSLPGLVPRFEQLDREVRSAQRRRQAWAIGLLAAFLAAFAALLLALPGLVGDLGLALLF